MKRLIALMLMVSLVGVGCSSGDQAKTATSSTTSGTASSSSPSTTSNSSAPTDIKGPFTLCPSEYPSWSVFMTATKAGLLNGEAGGEHGILEKKWGVDIVVQATDYDTCITKYGNGSADAVCITNSDILNPSLSRPSTAILPTSTSFGADSIIGVGIQDLQSLKGVPVHGLEKSVSQFAFIRILESAGLNPSDYTFTNKDPEAAAQQLQSNTDGKGDVKAIMVWNPFVLQTLRTNSAAKRIADTTAIPEEVVDMVVIANASLQKPGGDRFAHAVIDTFYTISDKLSDPDKAVSDLMRTKLGEDFSNLNAADMQVILRETSFYATPEDGINLFESVGFKDNMQPTGVVPQTMVKMGMLSADKLPKVSFGSSSSDTDLTFSTQFMKHVASKRTSK